MIPNIVVPIPIPIKQESGDANPKVVLALFLAIAIIAVVLVLYGFIYDGIRRQQWTLRENYNFSKMTGYFLLKIIFAMTVLLFLIALIMPML